MIHNKIEVKTKKVQLVMLTLSQVGTLLLYPVARIIESNSFSCPFINLAPLIVISFTFSTTCNLPKPLAKAQTWLRAKPVAY